METKKNSKQKEYKERNTYLYMKNKNQRIIGWILSLLGLFLIMSTFLPELLMGLPISLQGNDLISIYIGALLFLIGYSGIKTKW